MSHTTGNSELLIRSELWSSQLKDVLLDELMAQKYVRWLTEFPDGTTFTIPSIGQATVHDYVEDTAATYDALDTGEFQFSITEYLQSGLYITEKLRQDSFYASQLEATFVPKMQRALSVRLEQDILALGMQQTLSDPNTINGAAHRFVATGTNEVMTVTDFALAQYSLNKANVPVAGRVAIVDPSVEFELGTQANIVNLLGPNPLWGGDMVATGAGDGMRFYKNLYGFDIYISQHLADANETIAGPTTATTAAGKANLFFNPSVDGGTFIGAMRQMPKVDGEFNKDFQREEYMVTARYGVKLYRPESLVVILSDTDQVA
jgi:hypothetical protein